MVDAQSNIDVWQEHGHRFVDNMATVMRDLYLWRDALILVMYSLGINEKTIDRECLEKLKKDVYGKGAKVSINVVDGGKEVILEIKEVGLEPFEDFFNNKSEDKGKK